ncbi:MAG: pseudouridine-5'-phosphate glycosidase [Gemmatimonadota bacterium]|nr:pseudouridine-5'-phosphate glycosidase [Gemmatimonadota bacterium]
MGLERGEPTIVLRGERPLLALETAFLSTGLPGDVGASVAERMEVAAREAGATPAFVGAVEGRAIVGLGPAERERVAASGRKLSTRDLPAALSRGDDGGTTVAATLFLAWRSAVPVTVTGGIGGVHAGPGPEDVSADLLELSRTPAVLVCSGAKAILDLPATVERLESLGVAAVGFGTDEWPAFWTSGSGIPLATSAESAEEVAAMRREADRLGFPGAILVCVPPPSEASLDPEEGKTAVERALEDADREGVEGPALTPWLLDRVADLTEGRSLTANRALLVSNAGVAARIAVALREAS